MKKIINIQLAKKIALSIAFIASMTSCSDDEGDTTSGGTNGGGTDNSNAQELDLTTLDNGSKIFMQGFYWDVEPIGEWYNTVATKLEDWKDTGVDRIWMPSPAKGQSGMFSMGYDPSDYFDLGDFFQHGTTETRFGSRAELESFIQKAHDLDLEVIADIVISHNSGGGKQENPYRPGDTEVYTLFNEENGNASGKFNRDFNHFHPNGTQLDDGFGENPFYAKTDLSHAVEYVQNWLWADESISVANYYSNVIGFDGWRFDFVKSFDPKYVKAWNEKTPGLFSVGENFDGNAEVLKDWVDASDSPAFDFACFYKLEEALDRNKDLTFLDRDMLRKIYPDKAVTFVSNHDTEKDESPDNRISAGNKMLAYAYILTHDGYPTLFYSDYENSSFKPMLKKLALIYRSLATGGIEILEINENEYIMKRSGEGNNPGLILYMNIGNNTAQRQINTDWNSKTLIDYVGNSKRTPTTAANGTVTIEAPAKSFSIWSVAK